MPTARANSRIAAISWLVRGKKEYSESEVFKCEGCQGMFDPDMLDLAHRSDHLARKDRSGGFQSQSFGSYLLSLPRSDARRVAHVLCPNCHRRETIMQRKAGWKNRSGAT